MDLFHRHTWVVGDQAHPLSLVFEVELPQVADQVVGTGIVRQLVAMPQAAQEIQFLHEHSPAVTGHVEIDSRMVGRHVGNAAAAGQAQVRALVTAPHEDVVKVAVGVYLPRPEKLLGLQAEQDTHGAGEAGQSNGPAQPDVLDAGDGQGSPLGADSVADGRAKDHVGSMGQLGQEVASHHQRSGEALGQSLTVLDLAGDASANQLIYGVIRNQFPIPNV